MTNRDRWSAATSSASVGRCAISIAVAFLPGARHMTPSERFLPPASVRRGGHTKGRRSFVWDLALDLQILTVRCRPWGAHGGLPPVGLLGVELDDELLLHGGVDDLPRGQPVHEDAHPVGDDLEPCRHGALAGGGAGHDERGELEGALADLDDVVLGHPVARDVDLDTVDEEVAVPDELAGGVAGGGEAGP